MPFVELSSYIPRSNLSCFCTRDFAYDLLTAYSLTLQPLTSCCKRLYLSLYSEADGVLGFAEQMQGHRRPNPSACKFAQPFAAYASSMMTSRLALGVSFGCHDTILTLSELLGFAASMPASIDRSPLTRLQERNFCLQSQDAPHSSASSNQRHKALDNDRTPSRSARKA
jgi:hypothetical protein